MIRRNILRRKSLNSGCRLLFSCAARTSPPSPSQAASEKKSSFLGFVFSRCAAASFCSVNRHVDSMIPYTIKRFYFSSHAMADLPECGMVDVPLAQTGEGIAECELLKWFVKEPELVHMTLDIQNNAVLKKGDQIEDFQPLCEVQSDKATIEITSRYKGKVAQICYVPGDIVKVGETLLKMVVEESPVTALTSAELENIPGPKTCDSSSQSSVLEKYKVVGVLSTPAVRNLAKQYGISINDVQGSGNDGRVLKEDVLKYAVHKGIVKEPSPSFSTDSVEQASGGDEENLYVSDVGGYEDKKVPLRGYQRAMVKTMTMAAKIPHFHYVEEINCDAIVELKVAFQNENTDPNVKHTFLPLLIKSLSMALSKFPLLNSCFSEETQEVILKGSHNIGIAMATPHGLVVPNIKKVQSLSLLEVTKELSRLQQLALDNKLSPEDISGGTITLSNIGAIGGKFGSPLLNLPEVSIIAIGRIQKVPHFADDGNVYPVSVMSVNIGADHRVLDGATVARFCNEWKLYIEKPELLMLYMR